MKLRSTTLEEPVMAKMLKPDIMRISAFAVYLDSLISRGLLTSLRKERRALLLTLQTILSPHLLVVLMAIEDGGGRFLRNVSTSLSYYTASYRSRP
jgi:hypothetical protein